MSLCVFFLLSHFDLFEFDFNRLSLSCWSKACSMNVLTVLREFVKLFLS